MIGQRIKQLRLERKITLPELADRAGIAKSYLSSIERDIQSNPSISVLEKIANVLEAPVHYFLSYKVDNPTDMFEQMDAEWIKIMHEAMNSGITKEDFRNFLEFESWKRQNQKNRP